MKRFLNSFVFAAKGLKWVLQSELNFRIHFFATILVVIAGFIFSISGTEWILITITIAVVLAAEILNTCVEKLCDLYSKEFHPVIGKIKDMAALAVLICAVAALITGIIIFLPKIIQI